MLRRKKLRDLESDFFDLNLNSLLLTICKIVHIFFSLCMSQFLQPDSWDQNTIYLLKIMWGLNKIIHENNSVKYLNISSVQLLSRVQLFVTPWTAEHQASPSITNSRSPPKPMSIESMMPSNHLILCRPILLLPTIFPSIRSFQMRQHQVAKVLEFQLQHQSFSINTQDWSP